MKKVYLIIILLLLQTPMLFAQKQEKIYYNQAGEGCSKKDAFSYKIVTLDKDQKPIGLIKDYYITGELMAEGQAISIDKKQDLNTKWINKVTFYNKVGDKIFEQFYDAEGNQTNLSKKWNKNGTSQVSYSPENEDLIALISSTDEDQIQQYKSFANTIIEEGVKIIRQKNELGDISYTYYKKDDAIEEENIIAGSKYDRNYNLIVSMQATFERTAMEKELARSGFKLIQRKIKFLSSKNSVVDCWTHNDFPYCFYFSPRTKKSVNAMMISNGQTEKP